MLLVIMPIGVFADTESDTEIEMSEYTPEGSDKAGKTYLVRSAEDLKKFNTNNPHQNFKNATVKLMADIDYSGETWTGIVFNGTFDGNGYTISNVTVGTCTNAGGMFKFAGGTIKNLYINGLTNEQAAQLSHVGGLVGSRANSNVNNNGLIIDNVHIINGKVSGKDYVGGIIGNTNCIKDNSGDTSKSVIISNCSFSGSVSGSGSVGGIVGYCTNVASLSVSNCSVNLTGSVGATSNIGSIVGQTKYETILQNCVVAASEYNPVNFVTVDTSKGLETVDTSTCRTLSASADYYGYQTKAHDGKVDYRLVGVLDLDTDALADFSDIGFFVTLTYNGSVKTEKVSCKVVYTSVLGNETKYTTAEETGDDIQHIDGDYLYALVISGVPEDVEVSASVTAYMTVGEGDNAVNAYGSAQALTLKK